MKGTSPTKMLNELGWEDLRSRRQIHKLAFFYKIVNGLAPSYLEYLLPLTVASVQEGSCGLLINQLRLMPTRTKRFYNSFPPSTIRLWNALNVDMCSIQQFNDFKVTLTNSFCNQKYNKLFNFGINRYASALHERLRFDWGHSALNENLFRMNCVPSPHCRCKYIIEKQSNTIFYTALVMPLSALYFLPQLVKS